MKQPEALRLADELEINAHHAMNGEAFASAISAAAELRRQHAEIERLTKFCDDLTCELSVLLMAASMQNRNDEQFDLAFARAIEAAHGIKGEA